MSANIGIRVSNSRTAKELLQKNSWAQNRDGYYYLYPQGPDGKGQLVYCDMTTDGGGWMLIARSHPTTINYMNTNWGWKGGQIGSVTDFNQAYQAGWAQYWDGNVTFTEFIFGNQKNSKNNLWGYFVYKVGISDYTTFITSDTQQTPSSKTTLKSDPSVYTSTSYPGMQSVIGFTTTGTTNNIYYLRDCCGFAVSYGGKPTSFGTTYCNDDTRLSLPGAWCGGATTDINNDYVSGSVVTAGGNTFGGTNQYMIMVR
jgi:hypothetical protein